MGVSLYAEELLGCCFELVRVSTIFVRQLTLPSPSIDILRYVLHGVTISFDFRCASFLCKAQYRLVSCFALLLRNGNFPNGMHIAFPEIL